MMQTRVKATLASRHTSRQTYNAATACVAAEHDFDRLCVLAS